MTNEQIEMALIALSDALSEITKLVLANQPAVAREFRAQDLAERAALQAKVDAIRKSFS
jgi:hypothetical protein